MVPECQKLVGLPVLGSPCGNQFPGGPALTGTWARSATAAEVGHRRLARKSRRCSETAKWDMREKKGEARFGPGATMASLEDFQGWGPVYPISKPPITSEGLRLCCRTWPLTQFLQTRTCTRASTHMQKQRQACRHFSLNFWRAAMRHMLACQQKWASSNFGRKG